MSLQEDLEAFRELALEEQDRINVPGASFDLYETKGMLDSLLSPLVDYRTVCLTGAVWVPVVDEETENIVGKELVSGPVDGVSNGVYIRVEDDELDDVLMRRRVIGYWAYTNTLKSQDCVHDKKLSLMVFAPVESGQLSIPEDNMPDFEAMLPDENDEIAQEIDEAVLDSQIKFTRLGEIFAGIPCDSGLQVDFYLNYLNHIFPTEGLSFAMLINNFLEIDTVDGDIVKNNNLREYAGEIDGFQCISADDETVLCVQLNDGDEENDIVTFVPVRALLFCKLATSILNN